MVADRWPAVIIGNAHRSAVCLMVGAFLSCWLASSIHLLWVSIAVYVLAALTAAVGFVMTFRDYSF
jgi:hypothetical protein